MNCNPNTVFEWPCEFQDELMDKEEINFFPNLWTSNFEFVKILKSINSTTKLNVISSNAYGIISQPQTITADDIFNCTNSRKSSDKLFNMVINEINFKECLKCKQFRNLIVNPEIRIVIIYLFYY